MKILICLSFAFLTAFTLDAQSKYDTDVQGLSPLGFWTLASVNVNDSSVHNNSGFPQNGLSSSTAFGSPVENAHVILNGQNQYIPINPQGSSLFDLGSQHAFSVMGWFRTLGGTVPLQNMAIVSKTDGNAGWWFGLSAPGRLTIAFQASGLTVMSIPSPISYNDGTWHFAAATYDGSGGPSGLHLYIDGVALPAVPNGSLTGSSILNSAPLTIGGQADGSAAFNGWLNGIAVFDTALTPARINQLAEDGYTAQGVLAQFAFGGGWYSAIHFANTTGTTVTFPVTFTQDDGTPLPVTSIGGSSTFITLGIHATTLIEAPNSGPLKTGWVSFRLPPGVTGYGVFRQSVTGAPDQEAVAPFSFAGARDQTFPFDETNYMNAISIVNPSQQQVVLAIQATDSNGFQIGNANLTLQPNTKKTDLLRNFLGLSSIVGKSGTIHLIPTIGSGQRIAEAALVIRFNGPSFTVVPVQNETDLAQFLGGNCMVCPAN